MLDTEMTDSVFQDRKGIVVFQGQLASPEHLDAFWLYKVNCLLCNIAMNENVSRT